MPHDGFCPRRWQGGHEQARQPHRGRAAPAGVPHRGLMELELQEGWVEAELAEDFPELGLVHAPLDARPRKSPGDVKERLRKLADRYTGGKVIHMRQDAVPWAYWVYSRQVGNQQESDSTPV